MLSTLAPDTVLNATPWCVIREQEEQYLVYNSHTDELHLLPPTGYFAYRLCDGLTTLGEIERDLGTRIPGDPDRVRDAVRGFFAMLLARGIVEVEA